MRTRTTESDFPTTASPAGSTAVVQDAGMIRLSSTKGRTPEPLRLVTDIVDVEVLLRLASMNLDHRWKAQDQTFIHIVNKDDIVE